VEPVRLLVRRRLLEWVSAAQAENDSEFNRGEMIAQVAACAFFAGVVAFFLHLSGQPNWLIATPFAILWVLSPLLARWASLPPPAAGHLMIAASDTQALRLIARADVEVRSNPPDKRLVLERLVIELASEPRTSMLEGWSQMSMAL